MSDSEFPPFPEATPEAPKPIGEILQESREPDPQPAGEQSPAAPSEPAESRDEQPGAWTYAALKAERTKRQAFQKRAAELEAENQALMMHNIEPQQNEPATGEDFWSNPEGHLRAVQTAANLRASKAELIADHGRETLQALEQGIEQAMRAGHPDLPLLRDAMLRSDNPAGVAMDWWQSQGGSVQRQQRAAPVFPSNFAGARNVGTRSGPAWQKPTLNDIFDMRRPK